MLGIGFYHSGIEINGVEWSYGGNMTHNGTGVFQSVPLQIPEGVKYKESFLMGTIRNQQKVYEALDEVKQQFIANEYNLIGKNCNHFCEAFTLRLLDKKIPSYVNRAANFGYYFSCFLPISMKGLNPIPSGEDGSQQMNQNVSQNQNSFGSTEQPQNFMQYNNNINNGLDSSRVAFSGKGYKIQDYDIDNSTVDDV